MSGLVVGTLSRAIDEYTPMYTITFNNAEGTTPKAVFTPDTGEGGEVWAYSTYSASADRGFRIYSYLDANAPLLVTDVNPAATYRPVITYSSGIKVAPATGAAAGQTVTITLRKARNV